MGKRLLEFCLILTVVLTLAGLLLAENVSIQAGITNHQADAVYGQPTFFTSAGGAGANSFDLPTEMVFDGHGNTWIGEWSNRAVLRFDSDGDTTADLIIGQAGFSAVYGGTSDTMLGSVGGLTRDVFGNLYVSDASNSRILRFEADGNGVVNDTTADFVIGQPSFFTYHTGLGETTLASPRGLAIDRNGNLYTADGTRDAILRFNADSDGRLRDTTADFIFGQPSFHSFLNGASPHTFNFVRGLVLDPAGNLYVADASNQRVLRFNASETGIVNDTTPDLLFGQANYNASIPGVSDTMFFAPFDVSIDAFGNLWVADRSNNRVLKFNAETTGIISETTVDYVLGGGDSFFGFDSNIAGTSDTMMDDAGYLDFDNNGNLLVSDVDNNRVIQFNAQWLTFTNDDDCFIATAAYGHDAEVLGSFHRFRDEILMTSRIGRGLVSAYYDYGPTVATYVSGDALRFFTRAVLTPILGLVKIINLLGVFGVLAILILSALGYLSLRQRFNN